MWNPYLKVVFVAGRGIRYAMNENNIQSPTVDQTDASAEFFELTKNNNRLQCSETV